MAVKDGRLPARLGASDLAATAERQAREARQDAGRYARRGNRVMEEISLQAATDLDALAAAHRAQPGKGSLP